MDKRQTPQPLQALGAGSTRYAYDAPDASLLERFENPFHDSVGRNPAGCTGSVEINAPEFTSLCPITGQPDFAVIVIHYQPDQWCVESKSLKLYLGSFRNHGEFHESCVCRIANDLVGLLNPNALLVRGEFTPRGGIPFWPTAEYYRPFDLGAEE